ncbi:hypothetical protein GCM10009798_13060 [Nocardioides panacihumi]|uniref:Abortive infection protein-like C-terminal domain-containing protein n=1 Tax=Nocardioides panacihumi TaxID=400774 RepID=A0ABN2QMM3_9ACTN
MDVFDIKRPDHLDDEAWAAVSVARDRLSWAWQLDDGSDVIGRAKDLIETVAKVVLMAVDGTADDKMDLQPLLKKAQAALKFQPGPGLSHDEGVRAVAQAVQTMATQLGPIRNSYGTGHGRATNPDVGEELPALTLEAGLMWTRWALRRLGHVLADYPNDLIEAVGTGTSLVKLRKKFADAVLSQQPVEVQHRIGVAFGRQAAGGFGNAVSVGVAPVVDAGFDEYPVGYRCGVLEGMLLHSDGEIGLTNAHAPLFVSVFGSLPEGAARELAAGLRTRVVDAAWIDTWRGSPLVNAPTDVTATLRAEGAQLDGSHVEAFGELLASLDDSAMRATADEV